MKLYLSPEVKIKDLKKSFENSFPYLKIEFLKKSHLPEEGSPKKDIVTDSSSLIEVADVMREGEIEIRPDQTVAEVEQVFQTKFYLPVQIFRKSNSVWIETTTTDNFTLEKQNKMGMEACGFCWLQ